jgi:hypothetical protein
MASNQSRSKPLPERIFAIASPKSVGGVSLFDAQTQITAETVVNFFSDEELINRAVGRLRDAGFDVLQVTQSTINFAGVPKAFADAFDTQLFTEERPVIKPGAIQTTATFIDTKDTEISGLIDVVGTRFEDVLEGVAIEEPRYYMASSVFAPTKAYWHLDVPAGISLGCNADRAHRSGITGKGMKVAMVDSGHYAHPFFAARGFKVSPIVLAPGASNSSEDESGHGTGESANIFAVAPDVELLPVKMSFVNTKAAFDAAVGLGPDIITCSWGSSIQFGPLSAADQALAASIATAVAAGIVVVFSAGNGHWGFPGQHPDVISAGGTYMQPDGMFMASNYASGFMSNIYTARRVPDLCGLVGMLPRAIYIMLPVEPNDQIDNELSGSLYPNGDETTSTDGWAAFSGTSAAAPQLAGAAALVKQACPRLTPASVRDILTSSARDVTQGTCNPSTGGNPATVGPDTATGYGLVDAERAVLLAKLRCLGPIQPRTIGPISPVRPVRPVGPIRPIQPIQPIQPVSPIRPIQPIQPIQPVSPIRPIQPVQPIRPIQPVGPITPTQPGPSESAQPTDEAAKKEPRLSADDIKALEELARKGEIDLGHLEKIEKK